MPLSTTVSIGWNSSSTQQTNPRSQQESPTMPPTPRAQQAWRKSDSALKVFLIPELLEQILLNTTFIDLLVLQRVNKTFHTLISDSPALQRRLLTPEYHHTNKQESVLRLLNHLRLEAFEIRPPVATPLQTPDVIFLCGNERPAGPLGWNGVRAVHEHGGWENLKWGVKGVRIHVLEPGEFGWHLGFRRVELEETVGELVEALRKFMRG